MWCLQHATRDTRHAGALALRHAGDCLCVCVRVCACTSVRALCTRTRVYDEYAVVPLWCWVLVPNLYLFTAYIHAIRLYQYHMRLSGSLYQYHMRLSGSLTSLYSHKYASILFFNLRFDHSLGEYHPGPAGTSMISKNSSLGLK